MLRDILEQNSYDEIMRDEGRLEGMRAMARVAVEGRLGPLGPDLAEALNGADDETLQAIMAHVSTDSREQLRRRLSPR